MPDDNANELLKKLQAHQAQQQGEEGSHDAGKLLDEAAADAVKREQLLMQMLASMSGGGIMSNLIGAIKSPWYQGLTPGGPNSLTSPTLASQRPGLPIGGGGGGGTGTSDTTTPQGGYGGGGYKGGGGDYGGGGASGDMPPSPISRARTPFHDTRTWAGLGSGGRGKTPWHSSHPGISSGQYPGEAGMGSGGTGGSPGQYPSSQAGVVQSVVDEWRKAGMSDAGIAGVLANIQHESGFKPGILEQNPTGSAKRQGGGHGLYQFTGEEWGRYQGWLNKNHPGANWTDPALQSRFVAENVKSGNNVSKGLWDRMKYGTKEGAASAFVGGYERPRANLRRQREAQYGRGVPDIGHYGGGGTPSGGGESFGPSSGRGGGFGRGSQQGSSGGGDYPGGGGVIQDQSRVAGTRKGALSPTLQGQLQYAAQRTGLTFHATSGGQRMEGAPGATGSTRHDHGNAADGYLTDKNGRKLSMSNPEDRKRMGEFIKHSVAAGATGVGGAEGYMGEHNLHIGGGTPGTWGAGGSGKNTPGWVAEAYQAGQSGAAREEYRNRGQRQQATPETRDTVRPPSTTPKGDRLDRQAPAQGPGVSGPYGGSQPQKQEKSVDQKQEQLREALGDKYESVKPYLTPENMKKYDKLLNPETLKQYKDYITPDTLRSYLGEPPSPIEKEKLTKPSTSDKPPLQLASYTKKDDKPYTTQDALKDFKKQNEEFKKKLDKRIEDQKKKEPEQKEEKKEPEKKEIPKADKPKAHEDIKPKRHAHRSQHTGVTHHETPHRRHDTGGHLGGSVHHERRHHEEHVASGDGGTLVFLHGIHDRYAGSDQERNAKKDEIEKSVRAYATAHGYRDVKFVSGKLSQEQQQHELSNMIKNDKSVSGVFGFSRGGYSAHKALNSLPEEERGRIKQAIILGAPGTGDIHGVPTVNRGHMKGTGHMDMVQNWTQNQGTESGKPRPGTERPEVASSDKLGAGISTSIGGERIRTSAGKTVISTPADQFLASRITGVGPTAFQGAKKEGYSRSSSDLTLNYAIRGMSPETRFALSRAIKGYEEETGHKFHFTSAYRSPQGKGSSMASGKGSYHGGHGKGPSFGEAVDVGGAGKISKDAQGFLQYLKRHPEMGLAPKGLHFRDTGHTEFAGSRGGKWGGWTPAQKAQFNKDFHDWMGKKSADTPQTKDQSRLTPEPVKHPFSDYQKRNKQIQDSAARHGALHQTPPPPADTANKNPTVRSTNHTSHQTHEKKNTNLSTEWTHPHKNPSTAASSRVENAYIKPNTGRDASFSEAGHSNA